MFSIRSTPEAESDVKAILDWLGARSSVGAGKWLEAFREALLLIANHAPGLAPAPEARRTGRDLRQALFKTARGRYYRILFIQDANNVVILRVRGPGQRLLRKRDLPE